LLLAAQLQALHRILPEKSASWKGSCLWRGRLNAGETAQTSRLDAYFPSEV